MNICEKIGDTIVIRLPVEIDDYQLEQIRGEISWVMSDVRIKYAIFDFARTDFMDSSGIGLITCIFRQVYDRSGRIYLMNISDRLDRILSMSGIYRIGERKKTIDEAYRSAHDVQNNRN